MRRKKLLRQVAAAAVALSMAVSLSAPAFAATFDLSNGGLVITADESGITVKQDGQDGVTSIKDDEEIEITGSYVCSSSESSSGSGSSSDTYRALDAEENLSDPQQQKKSTITPANGELNASAGERQEFKAEDEGQPKPEAVASTSASTSASDDTSNDASNGSRKAPARSSGGESERTGIIQIFNNTLDKLVKLTLNNATIDQPGQAGTSARGTAAIDIQGTGGVEITVKGENTLSGRGYAAGIQKNDDVSTGKLTITAQDTNQKLTVKEGGGGVAIGGEGQTWESSGAGTKNIEINNGTLTVEGAIGSNVGNATGIKITGGAVVDVTGDIRGRLKESDDDSKCSTEIEISGNAQVNVKKSGDDGYYESGNIGQKDGKNEKITISGSARVNTEGCIGGGEEAVRGVEGSTNGTISISGNATVRANRGIIGNNSTVNISGSANVTPDIYFGNIQESGGQITISDNALVKFEGYKIRSDLTLKNQAKLDTYSVIDADKLHKDEASDGAMLRINIGDDSQRSSWVHENGAWKDVSEKLKGNCNHEKTYLSETIPSTCNTPGEKIYKCLYCGRDAGTEPVACLQHTWVKGETVAPTCTQKGYTVYECSVCHATKRDDETEPTGVHTYTEPVKTVAPTYTERGYTVYKCQTCDATEQRDWVPMLERESTNGAPNYTVTGAETYETSVVDGRYIIAVPSEDAALNAVLGDLRAIKAQGADVVVFRTRSRESSLVIDEMLAMGTDVTPFVLTHNGGEAQLTINGAAHNELIH